LKNKFCWIAIIYYLGSLGILLYTLLAGNTPFALDRNDPHELILARTAVKLSFTGPTWDRVSDNAKVNWLFLSHKKKHICFFFLRHL
jgi:hypothetical protein